MDHLNKTFSNLQTSPKVSWFSRPSEKCKSEFYTEKVELLVNWFKFSQDIKNREIYEYSVKIAKVVQTRQKTIKKELIRDEKTAYFWEFLRREFRRPEDVELFIFDDFETVYTCEKHPSIIKSNMIINEKKYEIVLKLQGKFNLIFSRKDWRDEENVNRSNRFLKCLFTQKFRYSHSLTNSEVNVFVPWKNSIHLMPTQPDDPKIKVAPGIEAWLGIYFGVRETIREEPVLNCGLVHSLYYNIPCMPLIDYFILISVQGASSDEVREKIKQKIHSEEYGMSKNQKLKATRLLYNLKMKSTSVWDEKRHLTFVKFCDHTANSYEIKSNKPNLKPISCRQLYENYHKPIAYPHLPLIQCKSGKNLIMVPIEVLEVDSRPQKFRNSLDTNMKLRFIQGATRPPHEHKDFTERMLNLFDFENPNLNFLKAFNISPTLKMIECQGKILNEPHLVNKNNEKIKMTETIRGFQEKCLNIVPQGELCIAIFILREDNECTPCVEIEEAAMFYKGLTCALIERGLQIGESEVSHDRSLLRLYENVSCFNGAECFQEAARDAKKRFEQLEDKNSKELLFLILSEKNYDAYGRVKYVCDHELGVANQVIDALTVKKANKQLKEEKIRRIFFNIALKINGKLNGVNQELGFSEEAEISPETKERLKNEPLTMYVGIDVTHPTQDSGIDISIASIVASINRGATKYRNKIIALTENSNLPTVEKFMPPRGKETTDVMENKFEPLLKIFAEENNNCIPNHIVVFRDGVSDSEMLKTAHDELKSLKKELQKFMIQRNENDQEPKYTYIVIQKRHHTRLYRKSKKKENRDRKTEIDNITSGTVCDKEIVSNYKFDFWLASHHGALGTSRPCHYTVMYDNSGITKDLCYKMCYEMAFLSFRCRKPISLPAPVHYAHLSCEKAKEMYKAMKSGKIPANLQKQGIEDVLQPSQNYPGMSFI